MIREIISLILYYTILKSFPKYFSIFKWRDTSLNVSCVQVMFHKDVFHLQRSAKHQLWIYYKKNIGDCGSLLITEINLFRATNAGLSECSLSQLFDLIASFDASLLPSLFPLLGKTGKLEGYWVKEGTVKEMAAGFNPLIISLKMGEVTDSLC